MTDATSDAEPAADADAEAGAEEQQPQFENRAARRAKGKSTGGHIDSGKGRVPGRSGTVQSPRQYGNRRSG